MNKSHIISLSSTFLFLVLGITFAILKSNNDEYLKSNPDIKNNNSGTYLGLSITFFVFFLISLCFTVLLLISPKDKNILTPILEPLMNGFGYGTPPNEISDDKTPTPLKLGKKILQEQRERESKIPKFPLFNL